MAPGYDFDYRGDAGRDDAFRRQPLRGYGRDYGAHDPEAGGYGWRRRGGRRGRLVPRPDWRAGAAVWPGAARGWAPPPELPESLPHGRVVRGYPGASGAFEPRERRENHPERSRRGRGVPPGWRRYLSREEYGLGPEGAYDREFEGNRFRRGPLGPRNALFGGEGFVRYDRDYDEQWW
ncbi:MAG TPA: hypothetical protein VF832_06745 [Longimicrobiales bacterium]